MSHIVACARKYDVMSCPSGCEANCVNMAFKFKGLYIDEGQIEPNDDPNLLLRRCNAHPEQSSASSPVGAPFLLQTSSHRGAMHRTKASLDGSVVVPSSDFTEHAKPSRVCAAEDAHKKLMISLSHAFGDECCARERVEEGILFDARGSFDSTSAQRVNPIFTARAFQSVAETPDGASTHATFAATPRDNATTQTQTNTTPNTTHRARFVFA